MPETAPHVGTGSTRRVAAWLFAGFVALYLLTASLRGPLAGDSGQMLQTAQHLTAVLRGEPLRREALSKFGLGQPLLDMSVAWALDAGAAAQGAARVYYMLVVAGLGAALGAAAVTLVFLTVERLGYRRPTALACALIAGLTTMTWPYSQSLYSDATVGLCWLAALWAMLVYRDQQQRWALALAGAAVMYAALCKVVALPALPALVAYAGYQMHQRGRLRCDAFWFIAPLVALTLLMLGYNVLRYGAVQQFGYDTERDQVFGFNNPLLVGVYGMLLSTGKGLFFYNPSLLLIVPAAPLFWRRHRLETVLLAWLVGVLLLVHAMWWAWHGDWSWGPRFLAGLPPLLTLMIAPLLERLWQKRQAVVCTSVAALLLLSMAVQLLGLLVNPASYIRITAQHTTIAPHAYYHAERWPIHDDGYYRHYVPQMSPLVGHLWLVRVLSAGDDRALYEARLSRPPWYQLNPRWAPTQVPDSLVSWNLWWLFAWRSQLPGYGAMLLLAAGLTLLSCFCLATAARCACRNPTPAPTGAQGCSHG